MTITQTIDLRELNLTEKAYALVTTLDNPVIEIDLDVVLDRNDEIHHINPPIGTSGSEIVKRVIQSLGPCGYWAHRPLVDEIVTEAARVENDFRGYPLEEKVVRELEELS